MGCGQAAALQAASRPRSSSTAIARPVRHVAPVPAPRGLAIPKDPSCSRGIGAWCRPCRVPFRPQPKRAHPSRDIAGHPDNEPAAPGGVSRRSPVHRSVNRAPAETHALGDGRGVRSGCDVVDLVESSRPGRANGRRVMRGVWSHGPRMRGQLGGCRLDERIRRRHPAVRHRPITRQGLPSPEGSEGHRPDHPTLRHGVR